MSPLKWLMSNVGIMLAASAVGFAGVYAFNGDEPLVDSAIAMLSGECNIKGNISMNTGERIYHVPGQRYYNDTVISTSHGERWFCSEEEARAAGWRKAKV